MSALAGWWGTDSNQTTEQLRHNIENPIGIARIPVGVAGPLIFNGQSVQDRIVVPMATTEALIVASATRGATAMNMAGGVHTYTGIYTYMQCSSKTFEAQCGFDIY